MHLAHQELLKRLGDNGGVVVIEKGNALLTPGKKRCEYTRYPCFFFPLKKIRHLDAKGFVRLLKERFPNIQKIVVGYDFAFGKDRKYSIEDLKKYFDGEVEVVSEQKIGQISIHSRFIKDLLRKGDIETANQLLGREYCVEGRIIKGQGLGKKELFPTINVKVEGYLLPKEGVYATYTIIDGKAYPSVTFIGHRLSTDNRFSVETHIIGQELQDRPNSVTICFVRYLRPNKRFEDLVSLKAQIQEDIQKASEIL